MAYHPNIPRANDNPTVSQGQLLDNFGTLNTDFAINHVPFTAGGNAGFHTKVQFTDVLVADPVVTGTQSAVYPKLVDGEPQLFFNNPVQVYPLTGLPFVNGTITNVTLNIAMTIATITSNGYNLLTGNSVTFLGVGGITGLNEYSHFTEHQADAGDWEEAALTGNGFPNHFYLRYQLYPHYFPLIGARPLSQPPGRVGQPLTGVRT